MIKTQERIAQFRKAGVRFVDTMPVGWHEVEGALTAPNGFVWIRRWNKDKRKYDRALLKTAK